MHYEIIGNFDVIYYDTRLLININNLELCDDPTQNYVKFSNIEFFVAF